MVCRVCVRQHGQCRGVVKVYSIGYRERICRPTAGLPLQGARIWHRLGVLGPRLVQVVHDSQGVVVTEGRTVYILLVGG